MAQRIVTIPYNFGISTMYSFVGSLIGSDKRPASQQILFDFSKLGFVDGGGLTVLTNILEWLQKRNVQYSFANYDGHKQAIRYLDDCGFFRTYLGTALSCNASVRSTTLPVRKIHHSESHAWLTNDLTPWLAQILDVNVPSLYSVNACIKEIFNNIIDHSSENIGCIHAQNYPNIKKICITISDFGRGIPTTISENFSVQNDGAAIVLATQEGITTKSTAGNRGGGLGVLIDYVVIRNGGSVGIYSEFGGVHCSPISGRVRKAQWMGTGYYPGTLVNIQLRTDTIERIEDERENFEW